MNRLSRLIHLASAATARKRVLSRFLWDSDRIEPLTKEIATLRVASYEGRLQQLAGDFGVPGDVHLADSAVLGRLTQDSRGVAFQILATHNRELRAFIARQSKDMSQAQLARAVAEWETQRNQWKAGQITLTEGMTGRNEAMNDVLSKNRLQARVRAAPRDAAEPICKALVARGWVRQQDADFNFPVHPNCVIAGTLADPIGTLEAVSRIPWAGSVVEIHCGSPEMIITVTPQHPVLTRRGWQPAELLRIGDDVLRYHRPDGQGFDLENMPASIDERFNALAKTGVITRTMPSAVDFHGDGCRCQGEIEIVYSNSFLMSHIGSGLDQERCETAFKFTDADTSLLTSYGAAQFRLPAFCAPSGGSVSGTNDGRVLLALAESYSKSQKVISDSLCGDTCPVCYGGGRHAAFVGVNPARSIDLLSPADWNARLSEPLAQRVITYANFRSEFVNRFAGDVSSAKVRQIHRYFYRGHVYDLQTSSNVYSASGLIIHNCKHSVELSTNVADQVQQREAIWLGQRVKVATGEAT